MVSLLTAIDAGLPILRFDSSDPLYIPRTLEAVLGEGFHTLTTLKGLAEGYKYNLFAGSQAPSLKSAYRRLIEDGQFLFLCNLDSEVAFDVGRLNPPESLILEVLEDEFGVIGKSACALKAALNGLTVYQIIQVCSLAQAQFSELTPRAVSRTKNLLFDISGLSFVPTESQFYYPSKQISRIVEDEKFTFLNPIDPRLRLRGLLFTGVPGVGKSQGAKFIAESWGVPLYRLNISGVMNKYVGGSENLMSQLLSGLDSCAPCVLLLDEIEKLFSGNDSSGVVQRLLSQLLWWLEEHSLAVLTIMTANNFKILPKELYRPGRIDEVIEMSELTPAEAVTFANQYLKSFDGDFANLTKAKLAKYIDIHKSVAHAKVVGAVHNYIKQRS